MQGFVLKNILLLATLGISVLAHAAQEPSEAIVLDSTAQEIGLESEYEKTFEAVANEAECALILEQRMQDPAGARLWRVTLNGKPLGNLETHAPQNGSDPSDDGFHRVGFAIPPDTLETGTNELEITGRVLPLVIRNLVLKFCPLKQALALGAVTVRVLDGETKSPIAARIVIVDKKGRVTKLYEVAGAGNATSRSPAPDKAYRPGFFYTLGGGDSFSLPAGEYTLYVTRGMEWGFVKQPIVVYADQPQSHTLVINREVDTTGFVACDSHLHTLPGSGHGSISYEERMLTIAGEGVEVAIATDHNHVSDYRLYQPLTGTVDHFHAVAGDEVTTHNGHFTAFPLDPRNAVPGGVRGRNPLLLEERDWAKLIADMRQKGADVVLLNHPYWPTIAEGPFAVFRFDRQTAGRRTGPEFNFNGWEVVSAANVVPDPFYALEDWLAMLNRGLNMTAVGASDSHRVVDPVGQPRSYLQSPTDDVSQLKQEDICRAFIEGRISVAAGIFAKLTVGREYTMGDLVPVADQEDGALKSIKAVLHVAAPSWIRPREAIVYLNGTKVGQQTVNAVPGKPTDQNLEFSIVVPPHDAHLVAFVLGDKIELPGWTYYDRVTRAVTNPIYLDVDGNNQYSSPRDTAAHLIAEHELADRNLSDDQQQALFAAGKINADQAVQLHLKDLLTAGKDTK